MKKCRNTLAVCFLAALLCFSWSLAKDRQALREDLIRLHVVADSDSREDQQIKLQVRDAVLQSIGKDLQKVADPEEARAYLQENLPKIQKAANETLQNLGCQDGALVTFCEEHFPKRIYGTFSLPSGLYQALRVTIGKGQGHNWWCVAYPSLCLPAAGRDVEAMAESAGISESLRGTMTGRYKIRFFLLDLLGSADKGAFLH